MRLPFFRAKDAVSEPNVPQRPKRPPRADPPALPPDDAAIAAARTQARRRLVGALVLLAVGVIGFPLLFETQPRPLPRDTPIVVAADALSRPVAPAPAAAPASRPLPVLPADAGVEPVPAASAPAVVAPVAVAALVKASAPSPAPAVATAPPAPAASVPANGRWVVQVGAYNDLDRLKAARAKLQKLGYDTYTQDVDSATGRRTRVRVGPYKTRAEADAVAARVKTAGLQAAVLSL